MSEELDKMNGEILKLIDDESNKASWMIRRVSGTADPLLPPSAPHEQRRSWGSQDETLVIRGLHEGFLNPNPLNPNT